MDLGKTGWSGSDFIGLVQDRDHWRSILNTAINIRVIYDIGNFF
jgi:hypothetical protein